MLLKQLLELNLFPSLFTRPEEDPTPSLLQISFIHRHLSLSTFSFGCLSSIFPRDLLFLFVSSLSPPLFSLSLSPSSLSRRKEERNSRQTNRRRILKAEWRLNLLSFLFWGHGNGEKRCSYIHIHVYRGA